MADNYSVRLFNSETALNSLRDTDFDFATAVGELLDNSLEAAATRIDTHIFTELQKMGDTEIAMIFKVVVMDNGDGMSTDVLHKCLQFGYSTRYNNRMGLGRFGVGATYAGISQCKKITVISRTKPNDEFQAICVDLAEIVSTGLDEIQEPFVVASLGDLEAIVTPETRTLVVWENCDRLD